MLPFLAAAGHYKYGQQSLPLYLSEMKRLPQTVPEVHEAMLIGDWPTIARALPYGWAYDDRTYKHTYMYSV